MADPEHSLNDIDAILTEAQIKICGAGTDRACYALLGGPQGIVCGELANSAVAMIAGIRLGWRVNEGEDGIVRCPKGVLANSKPE